MRELRKHGRSIILHESDGTIELRCGKAVFMLEGGGCRPDEVTETLETLSYVLRVPACQEPVHAELMFAEDGYPELRLSASGAMAGELHYPGPLIPMAGDVAFVPAGEGFAFPVDDASIPLCASRFSMNSQTWHMAVVATSRKDGAWLAQAVERGVGVSVLPLRPEGLLTFQLSWEPQLGAWGQERRLRFLMGDGGGLNGLCRAYRKYRDDLGQTATLEEKRRKLPQLDRLLGAADFWIWPDEYENFMYGTTWEATLKPAAPDLMRIAEDMKRSGCDRAMMGIFFAGDCHAADTIVEKTGYLVAKYDNMEDELPGDVAPWIPPLRIQECDFTARRMKYWPHDALRTEEGYAKAWALRGRDGQMHPQNHTCPYFVEKYTREEVPELARKFGFNAWFFDVMGCGAQECNAPEHPLTAWECVQKRCRALDVLAEAGLVAGTEEGAECYLAHICYDEGKMSPAYYRNNYRESGRRKAHAYRPEEHDDAFERFMLNPVYRIPFWELVYHDCAVNYWYWGDSSNCCRELMPKRDLFNALYGQPPLYSFHVSSWEELKGDIFKSLGRATPVARLTGYARMTAFSYCTEDRLVQKTEFSNGVTVTVNFSDVEYQCEDGHVIAASEYRLEQMSA